MLHLPTHTCPACNGPHQPARAERSAASLLRPYFASYTPLPATPKQWVGTVTAGGTVATSTWEDLVMTYASGDASTHFTGSGTDTLTCAKAGRYFLQFAAGTFDNGAGGGYAMQSRIVAAGTTKTQSANNWTAQATSPLSAVSLAVDMAAGDTVKVGVQHSEGNTRTHAGSPSLTIEFSPTQAYPN